MNQTRIRSILRVQHQQLFKRHARVPGNRRQRIASLHNYPLGSRRLQPLQAKSHGLGRRYCSARQMLFESDLLGLT